MTELFLKIIDKDGNIRCMDSGEEEVSLVFSKQYQEGDQIQLDSSEKNIHIIWQADDAMGPAFVYVTDTMYYAVPFGEKRASYSPKAFYGDRHYLYARAAREDEVYAYRNLALNVYDNHANNQSYPHATANVETRGESVFAARNAIDGVKENRSHGEWPYQSWGINMQGDALMRIDFGRMVESDKVVLYTRADFPHDSWWSQVTLTFSDGTNIDWKLEKSRFPHFITFEKKKIKWIQLSNLIRSDDPSPFPALSQMEVYGCVCEEKEDE